ncbi:MAG TPA: HAMP domain-containing sensor histidine kinase [Acidimicrobiales bacterium]|nr:HAMP domain-containing sensor histidine kinase [Acidimicrobiales bacterium]
MRRRLVLVVAATTGLVVVAFAIPLGALVRDVAHDRATTAAERDAAALAPVLAVTQDPQLLEAAIVQTPTGRDGHLAVFLGETVVGDDAEVDESALALARQGSGFTRDTARGAEIYSPVLTGSTTAVVRARVPDDQLDEGVGTAWAALGGVGGVLLAGACLLADRLARSVTRDAAELAGTARALASGDTGARARAGGVQEIADVAAALNSLADRIDELRAAERERVADLSHRLRTPLTVLRLEADRARIPALIEGVDRLERDISQIIRDARRPLHDGRDTSCDLAAVMRDRAGFWHALAEEDGRTDDAVIDPGPLRVRLAEDEAVAAVDALLTNVFTHTPDGTAYVIELARTRDSHARLVVRDAGPGVGDPAVVSERGVSGASSTGLGLDIVRRAAHHGGGEVQFVSPPGGGLEVVLDLPLVAT